MKGTMSFFCPWQDGQFEKCRRTGDTTCLPGKAGCVLFGKVEFAEETPGRKRSVRLPVTVVERRGKKAIASPSSPARAKTRTRSELLESLEAFPSLLRHDLLGASFDALVGRWTVCQVVHHLADVHAAGLARVRRALTEVEPKVNPYDHESWARLDDARDPALMMASLGILEGTHARWAALLRSLSEDGWVRAYRHPQARKRLTVAEDLAWHVQHGEVHRDALRRALGLAGPS